MKGRTPLSTFPANAEYSVNVRNPVGTNQAGAWTVRVVSPSTPGSTVVRGNNADHQAEYPIDLTNMLAVAAGRAHCDSLQEDGRVRAWGDNQFGQTNVPSNLSNVVAIAAGDEHSLALNTNGNVIAWGRNTLLQTNVPPTLTNAVAVSAGGPQSLALRKDGSVIQWGLTNALVPSGLTNVSAIATGTNFHLALLSNSTVVAWGLNNFGQTNVPAGLSNVVGIAACGFHALALRENGTVVGWGANESGQTNVPAGLSNVMAVAAGWAHSVALRNDGTVLVWGDNTYGEANAMYGLGTVKSIAAGGNNVMASTFSPLVQYPVDVTKDLLLIYNATSTNSIWVKNYYLARRPMVSGANELPVSCLTNELMANVDFTNLVQIPYLNWLNDHPTKRPQYLIWFLDLPGRVGDGVTASPSPNYLLHTATPGIPPFVTCINMDGTNDCRAYIDKLEFFGTNYSLGKLLIRATAGGYGNTNYYFDDTRVGYNSPLPDLGSGAATGVLTVNPTASVTYSNTVDIGLNAHITNGSNLAGYFSWGFHSSLGIDYAITTNQNAVKWTGQSRWWIIETVESYNGLRPPNDEGNFIQWYSSNAFGGSNYLNTPVGAVTHVDEPSSSLFVNDAAVYFGLWAGGKNFGISAWNSRRTDKFQAVGDPFVTK